jgi:hypothetical protein
LRVGRYGGATSETLNSPLVTPICTDGQRPLETARFTDQASRFTQQRGILHDPVPFLVAVDWETGYFCGSMAWSV